LFALFHHFPSPRGSASTELECSLHSFLGTQDDPFFLDSAVLFHFSLVQSKWVLHHSPAPNFKTFQEFLIHFPKCPVSSTIPSYAPNVHIADNRREYCLKPYSLTCKVK
jgi:hypothetical protein